MDLWVSPLQPQNEQTKSSEECRKAKRIHEVTWMEAGSVRWLNANTGNRVGENCVIFNFVTEKFKHRQK